MKNIHECSTTAMFLVDIRYDKRKMQPPPPSPSPPYLSGTITISRDPAGSHSTNSMMRRRCGCQLSALLLPEPMHLVKIEPLQGAVATLKNFGGWY